MPTIAIIGAGPGLGSAVARRFGQEGLAVALIARNRDKLDRLRHELVDDGINAYRFTADIGDIEALRGALDEVAAELGPVEVVQFSPVPSKEFLRPVLETSIADLQSAVALSILGPVAAVQQVLPGMKRLGRGTILLVNGSSAVTPNGKVAGTSIAFAGESAYGAMLHDALKSENIHVAQLIIPGAIGGGDPLYAPETLADQLWNIHRGRGDYRVTVGDQ